MPGKVLLLLHTDVLDTQDAALGPSLRQWFGAFAEALRARGWDASKLGAAGSPPARVQDYPLVHCFSGIEAETWAALKNSGRKVIVTPSLEARPDQDQLARAHALRSPGAWLTRGAKALRQRAWPPRDERVFFGCADGYLVTSEEWGSVIRTGWGGKGRVQMFPMDPQAAAATAAQLYQELLTQ